MSLYDRRTLTWALSDSILRGRMAFIAGPRQVGKTTAVQNFLDQKKQGSLYYNWDTPTVKKRHALDPSFFINDIPAEQVKPWVGFDEIHKYPKWKNILKGYYDEWHKRLRIVVTGSARLDLFRQSGDSLVGRYFLFRMLPLGVDEVLSKTKRAVKKWDPHQPLDSIPVAKPEIQDAINHLLAFSGYPEPFSSADPSFTNRWREDHISLLMREDLRDLTKITHIRKLETLVYLLPDRVGSPLSLNSLSRPLETTSPSIRAWLEALKKVYLVFSIAPWTHRLSRSVRKEQKYYFWDWGLVENSGYRFENFVAVQLQRAIAAWNETGKGSFQLMYLRSRNGEEVDFAVVDRKKVYFLVEVKENETTLSKTLATFKEKVGAPLAFQVVSKKGVAIRKGPDLTILGADRFLTLLP